MTSRDPNRPPGKLTRAEKKAMGMPPMPEWTKEHHHREGRRAAARKLFAERTGLALLAIVCFATVAFIFYWFQPELLHLLRSRP